MPKQYRSFKEIEDELKILSLRREIALQEFKISKSKLSQNINPLEWINPDLLKTTGKLGMLYLLKKFFKV